MIGVQPARSSVPLWATAVGALGLIALASRQVHPAAPVIVLLVGGSGLAAPVPAVAPRPGTGRWLAVTLLGAAAFGAVAALSPRYALPWGAAAAAAMLLAAVGEEAFFRRFLYGWVESRGPAVAVGATAVAFAAVHLPVYGVETLALNTAAGLVLGWQRWATGSWTAPAVTHAAANLLAFL